MHSALISKMILYTLHYITLQCIAPSYPTDTGSTTWLLSIASPRPLLHCNHHHHPHNHHHHHHHQYHRHYHHHHHGHKAANGLFLLKPPMHHFDSIVKFCRNRFWCKWALICRRVPHHLPMTQTQILFENWQLNSMMCQNLYKKCLFSEIRKALIFIFSVASLTFNTLFTKVVEYWILHIGENFIQQTGQWQD